MSIIWCYENVSNDYILDIIHILKQENIQIAPMCILNDFTVPHIYVRIADCQIFGPKCAAAALVDYIKRDIIHDFTDIYLTNDIQYIRSDILKLPDNYCIQCGEKFNESEMRLYYIKSTNDKFTLCKKCLHDNLPPTHNLTNAKCLSIFIRSNSDITYDAAISLINKARCIDKKRSVNLNAIIDTVLGAIRANPHHFNGGIQPVNFQT